MANSLSKERFSTNAVEAYERTYNSLFSQANIEVVRLNKINRAMEMIEERLMDPEAIARMGEAQQMALMELLMRSSNSSVNNLQRFAMLFKDIRNVTGTLASIKDQTAINGEYEVEDEDALLLDGVEEYPSFEDDD